MIAVDLASSLPLSEQIVREVRRLIAERQLVVNDELPTVRQLAADLTVNFNTVARAYRTLETSGLVRTIRGRGSWVVAVEESDPKRAVLATRSSLKTALVDARLSGLTLSAVQRMVASDLRVLWLGDTAPEKGVSS